MEIKTFSKKEVEELFATVVRKPDDDIVSLTLKAAKVTNSSIAEGMISALRSADLPSWKVEHVLATIAEYEGLDFVVAALTCEDGLIRDAAVYALLTLNDENSVAMQQQLLNDVTNYNLKQHMIETSRSIPEYRRVVECKQVGPLIEKDYVLAEALLDRHLIPADLQYVMRKLGHKNADARRQAVNTLLKMSPNLDEFFAALEMEELSPSKELFGLLCRLRDARGSTYVVKLLETTYLHWDLNDDAMEVLILIPNDAAITYLVSKVASDTDNFRELQALKKMGEPARAYILQAYSTDHAFRRTGGRKLVELVGEDALPLLCEALSDRFRQVRNDAESALVDLGSVAVGPLLTLLHHKESIVRRHACRALGSIGDRRAFDRLAEMSHSAARHEQLDAIEALGGTHSAKAIDELSRWLRSPNWETRRSAVRGLAKANSQKAILIVVQAAADEDRRVRLQAVHSMLEHLGRSYSASQALVDTLIEAILLATEDADLEIAATAKNHLIFIADTYNYILQTLTALRSAGLISGGRPLVTRGPGQQEIVRQAAYKIVKRIEEQISLRGSVPPAGHGRRDDSSELSSAYDIPAPITDNLHFTITAPAVVTKGDSFVLDVWAHYGDLKRQIFEEAQRAHGSRAIHIRSRGPVTVKRYTTLTVLLSVPTFGIEYAEEEIYWAGETGNCTFAVNVPLDVSHGFHLGSAKLFVGDLAISTLSFEIVVGLQNTETHEDVTTRENKVRTAFASYAHEELNKVTARIQGMLKILPELDIFLDVAALRSGENWRKRLEQEIVSRDIFYLFWSRAASKSEWVDVEWRTALATRGLDYIDPVPLEPADKVPPPSELAALHFNDWTLAFEE